MRKEDVVAFFDRCASHWDAEMIRNESVIERILNHAGIEAGMDVLDVACGTGVLIPDYLARKVGSVTGVDISSQMIQIAKEKFNRENVCFICSDVEEIVLERKFDCIMVYNAFPHFPHPERLIDRLVSLLKDGGRLTIAHGMSREEIDAHHAKRAQKVSVGLMDIDELADLFAKRLVVTTKISDDTMYQITGYFSA